MSQPPIEIRKYPNRRYYNSRDSRHVTLEEIRDLVREGHDIRVVDSKTEEDITVAVLTQILLEIESPKLAFFPANFLQHLIRLNTSAFKSMTENYFKTSLASFVKSSASTAGGVPPGFGVPFTGTVEDWQKMWMGMFPQPTAPAPNEPAAKKTAPSESPADGDRVAELSRQMEEMRRVLEELQKGKKK